MIDRSGASEPSQGEPGLSLRAAALTLSADAAAFAALAAHPLLGGPTRLRRARHDITYFDTDAADLNLHGLTLASRRLRAGAVLRLTGPEGVVEVKAEAADIEALPAAARARAARAAARRPLRPWVELRLRRAARLLSFEGAMIEAAFEEGEIVAGTQTRPLREITLTLKAGEPAALYRLGLAMLDLAPLSLGVASQAERGFALAAGDAGPAPRARPPDFGAEATLDAALAGLLRQGLAHFLGAWPALTSSDAAEAVHQIRVALRRLRSLLAVLRKAFPAAEVDFLRAEAKRIADSFGPARDWRVFCDMVAAGPAARLGASVAGRLGASGMAELIALAQARAEAGQAQGAQTLAAAGATRFALALHLYVCARGWRNAAGEANLRALGEPAAEFAAHALERLFRRVRRRARGFAALAPEARHEMRIALKQLRYAVDFFGALFRPGAAVAGFAEAASELQDLLGLANDAAVAAHRVAEIELTDDPELAFAAGAVVGWCERSGLVDEAALRRAWKALRRARRFWRPYLPADVPVEAAVGG